VRALDKRELTMWYIHIYIYVIYILITTTLSVYLGWFHHVFKKLKIIRVKSFWEGVATYVNAYENKRINCLLKVNGLHNQRLAGVAI